MYQFTIAMNIKLPTKVKGIFFFWILAETDYKQLLDEVFVISGIIKVEVKVISRS